MATKTPAEKVADFNRAWRRGEHLDRLRRRANHFATPGWKRPLYRLQVRWYLWRHYRHVR